VLWLLAALLWPLTGQAQEAPDPAELIRAKLGQARPDFKVENVQPSVVDGIYEVQLADGPLLYTSADGDFFFLGDLFAVSMGGIVNLSEQRRDLDRKQLMAGIAEKDMIVFPAEGTRKASVTVFTDVDCFYCQKLHQEVPAMNKAGIEIRYLAYPRSGIGSESYRKIASAWCAEDRNTAMTRLKSREDIDENVCPGNPVAEQFMLGQQVGVRGTPALVLESGQMVPGYLSAEDLASRLGIN
jgi:thiol:disulfide interchange protein DsbC